MKNFAKLILFALVFSAFGCQKSVFQSANVAPATLRDVPAVKLNFRFETDVPAPPASAVQAAQSEERNAAIQNDFDQNRPQELLDKTLTSPDKQRVLAVYHKVEDTPNEFRLDMYSADGKLLRKITHDGMAIHFADTIVWSPTSTDAAFVALARLANGQTNAPAASPSPTPAENNPEANANAENANANVSQTPATTTPGATQNVLTFRTEQLYICSADGGELKPLTQNEGLIYFFYVWSPDGASLAALANTYQEWNFLQAQADVKKEIFVPAGRLRLIEKTGRERRLDDNLTTVRPVWSPDAAKVAVAFETQVRIYDAIGDAPTQAAIPLRNPLLISSKTYDEQAQRTAEQGGNVSTNANSNANAQVNTNANQNSNQTANIPVNQPIGTLPDPSQLVSFNPIINLEWTEDKMLYLQTGYIKLIKNEADSARSFLRWHRLIFSPQATVIK